MDIAIKLDEYFLNWLTLKLLSGCGILQCFGDSSLCVILLFFICQMLRHMEPDYPHVPRGTFPTQTSCYKCFITKLLKGPA